MPSSRHRWLLLVGLLVIALPRAGEARPRRDGRINLDVVAGDLRNIVRLLAEVGGVNVVLGDEVTGKVTVKLRGVRWDKALGMILGTKGLELEREGSILRIASRATLASERSQELGARVRCLREAPLRTWIVRPSHARAEALAPQLRLVLTPRGSVTVDQRTNTLIVRDVVCP